MVGACGDRQASLKADLAFPAFSLSPARGIQLNTVLLEDLQQVRPPGTSICLTCPSEITLILCFMAIIKIARFTLSIFS